MPTASGLLVTDMLTMSGVSVEWEVLIQLRTLRMKRGQVDEEQLASACVSEFKTLRGELQTRLCMIKGNGEDWRLD